MTKDAVWNTHNVIRLAREAGLDLQGHGWIADDNGYPSLKAFAKLIAEHSANVEREACAKVCENTFYAPEPEGCGGDDYYYTRPYLHCAELIRARGQA